MNGRQATEQFLVPTRDLVAPQDMLGGLNPHAVYSKLREWTRGSLPSTSIPSGTRGGIPGMLEFDQWDRLAWAGWRRYCLDLGEMHARAQRAWRFQTGLLQVAPRLPDPVEIPCSNLDCVNMLEAGRKTGECSGCRVRRHREKTA